MSYVIARWLLMVVNLGHLAIHGTALDGGVIDSLLVPLDAYVLSIAAFLDR